MSNRIVTGGAGEATGAEVEIGRVCVRTPDVGLCSAGGFGAAGAAVGSGFCWVWTRVFTTSIGQVSTPAIPPAVTAVKTSSPNPMSREPTHSFATRCSCS